MGFYCLYTIAHTSAALVHDEQWFATYDIYTHQKRVHHTKTTTRASRIAGVARELDFRSEGGLAERLNLVWCIRLSSKQTNTTLDDCEVL